MDLNTKFGLPLTELNMLKSIPREQLRAMGVDLERLFKSMGKCPECGEDLVKGECPNCKAQGDTEHMDNDLEKAIKKNPLVQKEIQVKGARGTFTRKVWVRAGEDPKDMSGDHHVQQIHKDLQAHTAPGQEVKYSHSDSEGHVFSVHSDYRKKVDKGGDGHEANIKYFHQGQGVKNDHLKYQSKGDEETGKYGVLDGDGGRKLRKLYQDAGGNAKTATKKDDSKKAEPKKAAEPAKKDDKPSGGEKTGGKQMSKDEAKAAVKALKEKYGVDGLTKIAEKNGLKWSRNDKHPMHDYMRLAMAMSDHFQKGGEIAHGEAKKEEKKEEPKKEPAKKVEPKKEEKKSSKAPDKSVSSTKKDDKPKAKGEVSVPKTKKPDLSKLDVGSEITGKRSSGASVSGKVSHVTKTTVTLEGGTVLLKDNIETVKAPKKAAPKKAEPKKDTKTSAKDSTTGKTMSAKDLHNSVWIGNDPKEGEMHVTKDKDGFYMYNNKWDDRAKTAEEAVKKLKKYGFKHIGYN